jgi:ankyrin repeat protein
MSNVEERRQQKLEKMFGAPAVPKGADVKTAQKLSRLFGEMPLPSPNEQSHEARKRTDSFTQAVYDDDDDDDNSDGIDNNDDDNNENDNDAREMRTLRKLNRMLGETPPVDRSGQGLQLPESTRSSAPSSWKAKEPSGKNSSLMLSPRSRRERALSRKHAIGNEVGESNSNDNNNDDDDDGRADRPTNVVVRGDGLFAAAACGNRGALVSLVGEARARDDDGTALRALLNERDDGGQSALHLASGGGHTDCVLVLVDAGAELDAADARGWTSMHRAARALHFDVCHVLLTRGADPAAATNVGTTTLHFLARSASAQDADDRALLERCVAMCLEARPECVRACNWHDSTLLHEAVLGGSDAVVAALIDAGADVNRTNSFGDTPLDMAERRQLDSIAALLKGERGRRGSGIARGTASADASSEYGQRQRKRNQLPSSSNWSSSSSSASQTENKPVRAKMLDVSELVARKSFEGRSLDAFPFAECRSEVEQGRAWRALSLRDNAIATIDDGELFVTFKDTKLGRVLHELDLSRNRLAALPRTLAFFKALRVLDVSHNELAEIPSSVCMCAMLHRIDVSHNKLRRLPLEITSLSHLTELNALDNPALEYPPLEVLDKGLPVILAAMRRIDKEIVSKRGDTITHFEQERPDTLLRSGSWTVEDLMPTNRDRTRFMAELHDSAAADKLAALDRLLRNVDAHADFMAFLKKEYADESLRFCDDVADFRRMVAGPGLYARAEKIYQEFLIAGADSELNVNEEIRNRVFNVICVIRADGSADHGNDDNGDDDDDDDDSRQRQQRQQKQQQRRRRRSISIAELRGVFDEASKHVRTMLAQDSFPRFVQHSLEKEQRTRAAATAASAAASSSSGGDGGVPLKRERSRKKPKRTRASPSSSSASPPRKRSLSPKKLLPKRHSPTRK